jgi:hypothetical protein
MQSAPLGFMQKEDFTKTIGFKERTGKRHYKNFIAMGDWGVDDSTLYKYALRKIREFSGGREPWFMTLLTVGTHPPYIVPGESFPTEEQAMEYAANAVSEFIDSLRDEGLLEDALVIITSDETRQYNMKSTFRLNHVPVVVLSSQTSGDMAIEEVFMQSDIMLSVLDYLGIEDTETRGRSLFRTYEHGRNMIFGNYLDSKIFSISKEGKIYVCTNDLDCIAYVPGEDLFDTPESTAKVNPEYLEDLRQFLSYNEFDSTKTGSPYVYEVRDKNYTGTRYIFGSHKISVNAGDRVIWRYRIKANDRVVVQTRAYNMNWKEKIFEKTVTVEKGESFSFNHEFVVPAKIKGIRNDLAVVTYEEGEYLVEEVSIEVKRGN